MNGKLSIYHSAADASESLREDRFQRLLAEEIAPNGRFGALNSTDRVSQMADPRRSRRTAPDPLLSVNSRKADVPGRRHEHMAEPGRAYWSMHSLKRVTSSRLARPPYHGLACRRRLRGRAVGAQRWRADSRRSAPTIFIPLVRGKASLTPGVRAASAWACTSSARS